MFITARLGFITADVQTERQEDRWTDERWADSQADRVDGTDLQRLIERQNGRLIDIEIDREIDRLIDTKIDKEKDKEIDKEIHNEIDKQIDKEWTEIQTKRQTYK